MNRRQSSPWLVSVVMRWYQAWLRLYPQDFYDTYSQEMVQVFREICLVEWRSRGTVGLLVLFIRTLLDLLQSALTERRLSGGSMSRMVWIKLGSLALTVGAIIGIAYSALQIVVYANPFSTSLVPGQVTLFGVYLWASILNASIPLLLILGLVAFYLRLPSPASWARQLGLVIAVLGAVLIFVGSTTTSVLMQFGNLYCADLYDCNYYDPNHIVALLGMAALLGGLLGLMGLLILGVAGFCSDVLNRFRALPIIIAVFPVAGALAIVILAQLVPLNTFDWEGTVRFIDSFALAMSLWWIGVFLMGIVLWPEKKEPKSQAVVSPALSVEE